MWLGPGGQNQPRPCPIPSNLGDGRPTWPQRRFLRRQNQCRQTASRDWREPRRKDQVRQHDVTIPVGQQEIWIPCRTSRSAYQPWRPRHPPLLRNGQSRSPASLRTVLSRSATQTPRKLAIPLCRSCVQEEMSKPLLNKSPRCCHSPEQRTLHGTWCNPEIRKAVALGYTPLKIHEVWHSPEEQCMKRLFLDYLRVCWAQELRVQDPPRWSLLQSQRILPQCARFQATQLWRHETKSPQRNYATSMSSTRTSSRETLPSNISKS